MGGGDQTRGDQAGLMNHAAWIRQSVLAALARDRTPGWSFTGHFQNVAWPRIDANSMTVTMPVGPQCTDAKGNVELAALLVLFDAALASPTRIALAAGTRMATTQLSVQFTAAKVKGAPSVETVFEGATGDGALRQRLSRAALSHEGRLVMTGHGAFVQLPPPPDAGVMAPLPWQRTDLAEPDLLEVNQLDARESAVLDACDAALANASEQTSFLRHFWGILPRPVAAGAECHLRIGPQLANRVGHVQGGILLGIAAETARVAVPRHSVFSNISAWFLSPGRDAHLECRASIVHEGRSFAVIRSEITGAGGVRVFEAMTAHAAPHRHAEVEPMAPVVKTPHVRAD